MYLKLIVMNNINQTHSHVQSYETFVGAQINYIFCFNQ